MPEDAPPCPACTTDLMVSRYAGPEDWICYGCSRTFERADLPATLRAGVASDD